jgi:transposase
VFRVLEDPNTTAILNRLIIQSSLPLRSVETDFAVDSSGFATSRFLRWFDHKYGVERKKAEWVKCHLACGVRTNTVTAAVVSDGGDAPLLPSLAATTAQNFTVRELAADKAYSSHTNLEFVDELGAVPFVPFKINSRGDTRPGIWERMYCEFTLNREDFLRHYHKRSNVESTFSMIKAKFGDAVRSRTTVAMKNEVLAKIVCHNLVVLVHEMHELGIQPRLAEPAGEEPRVLRFPTG